MTLYAESSAVVSWLLGEPPGDVARRLLASASTVFASELTLLECDRAPSAGRPRSGGCACRMPRRHDYGSSRSRRRGTYSGLGRTSWTARAADSSASRCAPWTGCTSQRPSGSASSGQACAYSPSTIASGGMPPPWDSTCCPPPQRIQTRRRGLRHDRGRRRSHRRRCGR